MATKKRRPTRQVDAVPLRIAIKLRPHVPKGLTELARVDRLDPKLGLSANALPLQPLIDSVDARRLSGMVERARQTDLDIERDRPDFSLWYQIVTPIGVNADELAKALRQLDAVETAYVMRPLPPPVSPGDDPRYPNQGYLAAAPSGIDAVYAWGFAGGDGTGVGFVDMEQGWNLNHEDLAAAGITMISGVNSAYFYHGTSVLGELRMVDNTFGGVGIAPPVQRPRRLAMAHLKQLQHGRRHPQRSVCHVFRGCPAARGAGNRSGRGDVFLAGRDRGRHL
jgi:serine protease